MSEIPLNSQAIHDSFSRQKNEHSQNPQTVEFALASRLQFISKEVDSRSTPVRCSDGRESPDSVGGPQMLGGSLFPTVIAAINTGSILNRDFVANQLSTLQENGFPLGVHRGSDADERKSDCGFADRLGEILSVADNLSSIISERLKPYYYLHPELLGDISHLDDALDKIKEYNPHEKVQIVGEELVAEQIANGAYVERVVDEHKEELAFVNVDSNVTLDTPHMNLLGRQAFNLDVIPVIKQAQALGVSPELSLPIALALYIATEMILVESKGKKPLSIVIDMPK